MRDGPRAVEALGLGGDELTWRPVAVGEGSSVVEAWDAHVEQHAARVRGNAASALHLLIGVSPGWVEEAGSVHDPENPRLQKLAAEAVGWAADTFGGVFAARADIDEEGGAVIDVMCAPIREQGSGRGGKRRSAWVAVAPAIKEMATATRVALGIPLGERGHPSYRLMQDSWSRWVQAKLDPEIRRGKPVEETGRKNTRPEVYKESIRLQMEADRAAIEQTQADQADERRRLEKIEAQAEAAQAAAQHDRDEATRQQDAWRKEHDAAIAAREGAAKAQKDLEDGQLAVEQTQASERRRLEDLEAQAEAAQAAAQHDRDEAKQQQAAWRKEHDAAIAAREGAAKAQKDLEDGQLAVEQTQAGERRRLDAERQAAEKDLATVRREREQVATDREAVAERQVTLEKIRDEFGADLRRMAAAGLGKRARARWARQSR